MSCQQKDGLTKSCEVFTIAGVIVAFLVSLWGIDWNFTMALPARQQAIRASIPAKATREAVTLKIAPRPQQPVSVPENSLTQADLDKALECMRQELAAKESPPPMMKGDVLFVYAPPVPLVPPQAEPIRKPQQSGVIKKTPAESLREFQVQRFTIACRKCGRTQTHTAHCIADHDKFRCSCGAKIKVESLHDRLEDKEKHLEKLARR